MVVDQCGKEIVCRTDRVEVARKVQVDVRHRNNLRVATAGRAPFHSETGSEAGFAKANQRFLANFVHAVAQADRRRRFSFARRCRGDGCDQYQLAILLVRN